MYNKSDLAFAFQRDKEGDAVSVSAKTGEGLDRLLSAIDKKLDKGTKRVTLHLPYDKAGALDSLYREAKVESVEYGETVDVVAVCTPVSYTHLCHFGYFMEYGLRARERTKADFQAPEVGTFIHYLLENVLREVEQQGKRSERPALAAFVRRYTCLLYTSRCV